MINQNNTFNKYGILSDDLECIVKKILNNKNIIDIILFGSRAKGNYRKGSDIDIAILSEGLSFDELNQINQKKKAQEIVHLTAGIYKNIEPEVESCLLRENWERNVER